MNEGRFPTIGCCGARATPGNIAGHKCKGVGRLPRVMVNPALPPDVVEFRCGGRVVGAIVGVGAPSARPTTGRVMEDRLALLLQAEGYGDIADLPVGFGINTHRVFVRQYAWALPAFRDYRADFAWPAIKVMCEVVGGAHAAGRARVKADVERDGLAASLGWRVVKVTPEQVLDETAVAAIRAALEAR